MVESISEFKMPEKMSIAAAERAQENSRRHLENQDIIKAATELGLEEYAPQLVRFGAQRKRNAKRKETFMQRKGTGKKASASSMDEIEDTNDLPDDYAEQSSQEVDSGDPGPIDDDDEPPMAFD